jgi:hypothetical protein
MDGDVIVYDISVPSGKTVFTNSSYTCKHLGCVWQVFKKKLLIKYSLGNEFFFIRFDGVRHLRMIILGFVQLVVMEKLCDGRVLKGNYDKYFYLIYQVRRKLPDLMMELF